MTRPATTTREEQGTFETLGVTNQTQNITNGQTVQLGPHSVHITNHQLGPRQKRTGPFRKHFFNFLVHMVYIKKQKSS